MATTSLEVENKAIFAFWGRLIQRFGGGEHEKEGSVACPEAVLLDIMEIISFYASHEITMQDAFTQVRSFPRASTAESNWLLTCSLPACYRVQAQQVHRSV